MAASVSVGGKRPAGTLSDLFTLRINDQESLVQEVLMHGRFNLGQPLYGFAAFNDPTFYHQKDCLILNNAYLWGYRQSIKLYT
jgi:hypothetical protein